MLLENEGVETPVVETGSEETPNETQENKSATEAEQKPVVEEKPEAKTTEEAKSFTQEMVDEIVRNRLERDRKATFKRYGVEDRNGLDALIGKAQSYDVMKERYGAIKEENTSLKEKMAFMSNNINPAREEDVRAYFKGKEIEFNETNLVNELATHPEWLNVKEVNEAPQTTIKSLGVEHTSVNHKESEAERQKRIFGV
jgi:hypothetical protein